ncbi:hypothetical protein [Bittarella massiliensis (ex Durand et al. 2017)]|uniref:hypothetical protein n=1 Tax=Bittarella massiliensis (ex Durand et al. 2017) TaxID=1720313 RepID=UPI001AA12E61|nr:hypothetical protein [Bittarella massiliensis (ex Durand et al. 2017)]MBO1678693.1 hypothetical protein [Bittarella massiliensis (ex Durand et al. 2017)]
MTRELSLLPIFSALFAIRKISSNALQPLRLAVFLSFFGLFSPPLPGVIAAQDTLF